MGPTRRGVMLALAAALALGALAQTAGDSRRLPGAAPAGTRRLALVIGNNAYPEMPLRNAVNDARSISAALREAGFDDVVTKTDVGRVALEQAADEFAARVQPGDVAVVFYAGHGIELDGENYLLPVDFRMKSKADAKYESYAARRVLDKLQERGARLRVALLDACRNNPYSRSTAGGLAQMEAAEGEIIVFATKARSTASDNPADSNGLFTKHLVQGLRSGTPARQMFQQVKEAVRTASNGSQVPAIYDEMIGDFTLGAAASSVGSAAPPAAPQPPAAAPPATLSAPPAVGGLSLKDLEEQSKIRKQWGEYQARMVSDFAAAQGFEAQSTDAELKAAAWERFITTYAADNPLSAGDEEYRSRAQESATRWRQEVQRLAQVVTPPPRDVPQAMAQGSKLSRKAGRAAAGSSYLELDGLRFEPGVIGAGGTSNLILRYTAIPSKNYSEVWLRTELYFAGQLLQDLGRHTLDRSDGRGGSFETRVPVTFPSNAPSGLYRAEIVLAMLADSLLEVGGGAEIVINASR